MKTDQMSKPMREAILEIDGDILALHEENEANTRDMTRLRALRAELADLYGDPAPAPAQHRKAQKPTRRRKTPAASPTEPAAESVRNGRGWAPHIQVLVNAAGKLTEPITRENLHVATNGDKKLLGNVIARLTAKGWLEKIGRGQYRRTKEFKVE